MAAAEGAVKNGLGDSIRYNNKKQVYEVFKQQEKDVAPRGHFEEPNTLAHVRLTDRVGPNGERILFAEEIQSDWAQEGRREGFRSDAAKFTKAETERLTELDSKADTSQPNAGMTHAEYAEWSGLAYPPSWTP